MNRSSSASRRAKAFLVLGGVAASCGLSGVFAATAPAADSCPNAAVRAQQDATALPNCRAYEIVDPPTDDVGDTNRVSNIADDGSAVAYLSVIPGDEAMGGATVSVAVARRAGGGWTSVSADPKSYGAIYGQTATTMPMVFSPDFSQALLVTNLPASPLDINGGKDRYRVDVGLGTATLMTPPGQGSTQLFGATPNLDRVVFEGNSIDVYAGDENSAELLSVDPNGTPIPSGRQPVVAGGAFRRGLGVGEIREPAPWVERGGDHAVSDDALRVYLKIEDPSGTPLYVRDLTAVPKRTVLVSASTRTGDPPGAMGSAKFISATHDGATAYFASNDQLNDNATPGGGIYRFDLASQTVTQITPDAGDPTGLHLGGAIASDDQSHLYFTSTSALAAGAQAGDMNAYVWTSGSGVRFIAKVGAGDLFSRVTPDGRYALMLSPTSIDGAANNGFTAAYRYDNTTGLVTCVSCRPDGSPSQGTAGIEDQSPGFPQGPNPHNRALTFDGGVAFTSTDRVVTADQTSAQDVYLYDNETVSLLTAGRGDDNSYVGDVSDDGRNIFVISRSALVGADHDAEEFDVYDVRVDGGFLEPPPARDPCRGPDCHTPSSPSPDKLAQSSSRANGAGDLRLTSPTKRLSVSRLSSSQRSALARTGKVVLSAAVTGGGTLSVRGRGRIGGQTETVGSASKVVLKTGKSTVKVTFSLSLAARRELSRRHRLSITLEVRLSGLPKAVTTTNTLKRAHR